MRYILINIVAFANAVGRCYFVDRDKAISMNKYYLLYKVLKELESKYKWNQLRLCSDSHGMSS